MNVQITDYGVSLINSTKKPLVIVRAELGASYAYVPSQTAVGLQGKKVWETSIGSHKTVTGNVVKYELNIDYDIGPFTFGEIAYFDKHDKCVAIAVSDKVIPKIASVNGARGNSIRVDAYLSMVGENYDMWSDSIGSDITFQVPTVESPDHLPPVAESDPNFYIVNPVSSNVSTTLAYAGCNGLWEFDNYLFSNVREYRITSGTSTSISIDIEHLDEAARNTLTNKYYGDKLVEFTSGSLYSICRVPVSIILQTTIATISFNTPLAIVPEPDTTIYLFSRTDISISDLNLPIATKHTLGGIIVGDGLSVTVSGVLTPDFPVTSVNGQIGDVELVPDDIPGLHKVASTGNYNDLVNKPRPYELPPATATTLGGVKPKKDFTVAEDGSLSLSFDAVKSVNNNKPNPDTGDVTITFPVVEGLVDPRALAGTVDFNTVTQSGLYYGGTTVDSKNPPSTEITTGFVLEVIPIKNLENACVQRVTSTSKSWFRLRYLEWGPWTEGGGGGGTTDVASYNKPGIVQIVGNTGLAIDSSGRLSINAGNGLSVSPSEQLQADVIDFNGRKGNIFLTLTDVTNVLADVYNEPGGVVSPEANDDPWKAGRINPRQLPLEAVTYFGTWDAQANLTQDADIIDEEADVVNARFLNGGLIQNIDTEDTFDARGMVFSVTTAGSTSLDGSSSWNVGDLIACIGGVWVKLYSRSSTNIPAGTTVGDILYWQGLGWAILPKGEPNSVLSIDPSGNLAWTQQPTITKLVIS